MYLDKNMRRIHDALAKGLIDRKTIIAGGYALYRQQVMPADAGPVQLAETEQAFFAGAQHLFASIMSVLDPGSEPTNADLQRMDFIAQELEAFGQKLAAKIAPAPQGRA
jgi:hypothetical protein